MEEIKNEPIKNEPIKVKRPRRTKIEMMVDRQAKTELLHQKFLEASKETIKVKKHRRTKLEMMAMRKAKTELLYERFIQEGKEIFILDEETPLPKEKSTVIRKNAPYIKTNDQKESSKRQKNTEYWRTKYGIYVDPTNLEDYYWFKQQACTVRKMLPIMNKVRELQIPYDKRE